MPAPPMGMSTTATSSEHEITMMEIHIKDPATGLLFSCKAKPSQNEQENGWSVQLPEGNTIFITEQQQEWRVRHDGTISAELVNELGKAITQHLSIKTLHWVTEDDPEKPQDHREAERISREHRAF